MDVISHSASATNCSDIPKVEPNERPIEKTRLYRLISHASKTSLKEAWTYAWTQDAKCIQRRSEVDHSTYLHLLVSRSPEVFHRYGNLNHLIPLLYRLAMKGVDVNAQNSHGNTALHLACLKPNASQLCQHLIRIGADPCLQNKRDCRIIYTYRNHQCEIIKAQSNARSGLWSAVETEDTEMAHKMLKSWCRVNIKKSSKLIEVAEETSNSKMIQLLKHYQFKNELMCYALACDSDVLNRMISSEKKPIDLSQMDEAISPPKPLIVALQELGDWSQATVQVLLKHKLVEPVDYQARIKEAQALFESSEFFTLIEEPNQTGLLRAAEMISRGEVNMEARCGSEGREGWTYLHLVVDRYLKIKKEEEELSRLLLRIMYRMAMADIDMNARDELNETALIKASIHEDQELITHLIRLGANAMIPDSEGRAPSETVFEDRGKFIFGKKYRLIDLPGLWAAVELNDEKKTERWLRSWARVRTLRGDRRLIDITRAQGRTKLVQLMELHGLMNEFVCETFACNKERMMHIVAMGSGAKKVNSINDFYHAGYTWDRHAEYIQQPLIISALEICSADVIKFLVQFGADLSLQYEESFPCGPTAFWAFRDHISNENCHVIATFADVKLRDENGCTMLHRIIKKQKLEGKADIVATLLDRGVDVSARDSEGLTARDYTHMYDIEKGAEFRQMMDDHVMLLVINDRLKQLENLLLNAYDHILDIRDSRRGKTCEEVATIRQYNHIVKFLRDIDKYKNDISALQVAVKTGDLKVFCRLFGERKCALARDKGGRTLLHIAILYQRVDIVRILLEQFPKLVNMQDNLNRTPLHYCMCVPERKVILVLLNDWNANHELIDTNNMTPADYLKELHKPTPIIKKARGRRHQNYDPSDLLQKEKSADYGTKSRALACYVDLLSDLINDTPFEEDMRKVIDVREAALARDGFDVLLLSKCIELKREQFAIGLITAGRCRPHIKIRIKNSEGVVEKKFLLDWAREAGMLELVSVIQSVPKSLSTEELRGISVDLSEEPRRDSSRASSSQNILTTEGTAKLRGLTIVESVEQEDSNHHLMLDISSNSKDVQPTADAAGVQPPTINVQPPGD